METRLLPEKERIELIPPGPYCYLIDTTKKIELDSVPVVNCPHSTYKEINGVNVPWCNHLDMGGTGNETEEEYAKLVEYFGSDDNVFDYLTLDLLWDQVKSCGENLDENCGYNYTEEDANKWIKKVKDYEKLDNKE